MSEKRLTTFVLAQKNLKGHMFRTVGLIVLVTLLSAILFGGSMLINSIQNGIESTAGRFGADMMVVPRGSGNSAEGLLLRSEPGTFYLHEDLTSEIQSMDGIEKASPQLFVQSLNAACCTVPVQLIGYVPETDFTIAPWIKNTMERPLKKGEVVVGDLVLAEPGDDVIFFNQPFSVAAKLARTGMGFDSSVFMTLETAEHMVALSQESGLVPKTSENTSDISSIMIRIQDDANADKLKEAILAKHADTDIVISSDMLMDTSAKLLNMKTLVYLFAGMLWILCIIVLIIMFFVTVNERKSEFALFRAQGATQNRLIGLIVTEALFISIIGTVCGIIVASMIYFPFATYIGSLLDMPFLQPTILSTISYMVISAIITVAIGPLASLYPATRIGKTDTYTTIREN
ncbi:MAG: FtsX-like permease family protein [Christensenella sp.]